MINKYPLLDIFSEVKGKRVWRSEVHQPQSRKLSRDERRSGAQSDMPDGIYIVTVSEETPVERFQIAHLLNLESGGARSTQANGFVPSDNYDSAIAVVGGRIVGGVIADRGRTIRLSKKLSAKGSSKNSTPIQSRSSPVVWDLWVHPGHRRKGLGRQLVTAIAGHFGYGVEEMGYRFPISKDAIPLLLSMGLKKVDGCN